MKLSIVTITRDNPEELERTVRSVAQIGTSAGDLKIEHLIVDSSDPPARVFSNCRQIRTPARGIYSAMNTALGEARGDLVWFLHAGDTLRLPAALSEIANAFTKNAQLAAWIGAADLTRAGLYLYTQYPGPTLRKSLISGRGLCQQAVVYRREVFARYGFLGDRWRLAADYAYFWQLLEEPTECSSTRWIEFDADGQSNRSLQVVEERLRIALQCAREKLGLIELMVFWAHCLGGEGLRALFAVLRGRKSLDPLRCLWLYWKRMAVTPN